jgi:hypothetical protein
MADCLALIREHGFYKINFKKGNIMETTNKVVNNFHLLNAELQSKYYGKLAAKAIGKSESPMVFLSDALQIIDECITDSKIDENQIKINLIEGREKSHVPTDAPIEDVVYCILEDTATTLDFKKAHTEIMQAINNIPNMNISVKDLKYRIGILDGTEERISTEGEGE